MEKKGLHRVIFSFLVCLAALGRLGDIVEGVSCSSVAGESGGRCEELRAVDWCEVR